MMPLLDWLNLRDDVDAALTYLEGLPRSGWTQREHEMQAMALEGNARLEAEKPLWVPFPGPQTWAMRTHVDVLGFGGSSGGGKTDLLLGLALTHHKRSLLLRREAKQGRGIIDRAREIFGELGRFNENTGVWRDLPGGRQIEFGGCKDPGDEQAHKGRPKDLLGIDEADQFPEHVVRFLMGWVRTTDPAQQCRTVLCFNPPSTAEGRWLLSFFGPWIDRKHLNPAAPGEIRWFAMVKEGMEIREVERPSGEPFEHGGELIAPKSRTFIPARVQDNPALMAKDYLSTLLSLPEPLRSQLAYGDMAAGLEDESNQVIPTAWVDAAMARWKPEPPYGAVLDAIGADIARGGRDKFCLAKRYANWIAPLVKVPGKEVLDGQAAIGLIIKELRERAAAWVFVDVIGVGSSPYDFGRELRIKHLIPVNFAARCEERAPGSDLPLANYRAFAIWHMMLLLDPASGTDLALPPDRELLADLTSYTWKPTVRGIQIDSKDDIKKRLKRSPDAGEAVILACLPPPLDQISMVPERLV